MSLSNFPLAHQNFINSFSGTIKYVDITNGSDTNNGDTEATAYQTLAYAQSETSGISTPVLYVINPGTYNLTPVVVTSSGSAGFSDGNLPRTFFCAPDGQVVFQWTAGAQRDGTMVSLENSDSAVYGAVLKRDNNGKTNTYSTAMFNNTTTRCQGDFYNCVFIETNANGNWSLQYDNSGTSQTTVNNCTFYTIENGGSDWSSSASFVINDSAFNYTYGSSSSTKNNTIVNANMDETSYALLTEDNDLYGVYSGTYAWGQPLPGSDLEVEYLVVGGGGGGGETVGGGGGGGGVTIGAIRLAIENTLQISIGSGGVGGFTGVTGATAYPGGYSGNPTVISGFRTIGAAGGGAGGGYNEVGTSPAGTGGGQGGGQGAGGGAGVAPGTGFNSGGTSASNTNSGAGGGGAGAVGGNSTSGSPGAGGAGIEWPAGSGVYFAGGGGGGARDPSGGTGADGGLGGGGAGGTGANNGVAGADNTGGGGGGGGYRNSDTFQGAGGDGGSGVVKLRYPGNPKAVGGDIVTADGYTIHTFNADGSFTRSGAGPYVGFLVPTDSGPIFASSVNEGTTITVKFRSANQTGTVNYSITGTITSADIGGASLSGTVNIVDYEGTVELTISADATSNEGDETLTVSFTENSQTYQETLSIVDTSRQLLITPAVDSGGTINFTLDTSRTPQADGTQIAYTISGTYITEATIRQPLTGFFTMVNNQATLTINLAVTDSTVLTISTFGDSASCAITFTPSFADDVVSAVNIPVYQSSMIQPLLNGVEATLANNVPIGNQVSDYKTITIPSLDLDEVMVFTTTTTSDNGRLNNFVNLPLGAEIIKEYWI